MAKTALTNVLIKLLDTLTTNLKTDTSELSEEDTRDIIHKLSIVTDSNKRLSKYMSYRYLNMSRANFDIYVKSSKIPKGVKIEGFKEKSWSKIDLDKFKKEHNKK